MARPRWHCELDAFVLAANNDRRRWQPAGALASADLVWAGAPGESAALAAVFSEEGLVQLPPRALVNHFPTSQELTRRVSDNAASNVDDSGVCVCFSFHTTQQSLKLSHSRPHTGPTVEAPRKV